MDSKLTTADKIQILIAAISLCAVIVAAFSAFQAQQAAIETRQATQAQLVASLLDAYAAPEMLNALEVIKDWKIRYGNNFPVVFRIQLEKNNKAAHEVNHARRRVAHFFEKICTLYSEKFLDESTVRDVATGGQVKIFREDIEPLEATLGKYDPSCFNKLGSLYGIGLSPLTQSLISSRP